MNPQSDPQTPPSRQLLALGGWFLLLLGLAIAIWMFMRIRDRLDMQSWPKAGAEVVRSELVAVNNRSITWCASLTYRYVVDGRRYQASQAPTSALASAGCHGSQHHMLAHLARRKPGDRITIRYHPHDPGQGLAYIDRLGPLEFIFPAVALSLFAAGVTKVRHAGRLRAAQTRPTTT